MSEDKKAQDPLKRLKWFGELVENVPRAKGDSFTDKVVDLESGRLIHEAGKVAMGAIHGSESGPSAERGVSQGLEAAGRKIVENKLLAEDPISSRVLATIGEIFSEDLKARLTGGSGLQGEDAKELTERRRADEMGAIMGKMRDELIEPLAAKMQIIEEKLGEKGSGKGLTVDEAVDLVVNAQENAKKLLKAQGFSVESVQVTKEEVTKMLTEEQKKFDERLANEKEHWEQESGTAVEVERQRIAATENILTNVFDRVMDVFLEPIKQKIQEAIEKGAFRGPGG